MKTKIYEPTVTVTRVDRVQAKGVRGEAVPKLNWAAVVVQLVNAGLTSFFEELVSQVDSMLLDKSMNLRFIQNYLLADRHEGRLW